MDQVVLRDDQREERYSYSVRRLTDGTRPRSANGAGRIGASTTGDDVRVRVRVPLGPSIDGLAQYEYDRKGTETGARTSGWC